MTLINTLLRHADGLADRVRQRVPARVQVILTSDASRDALRAAAAGAILFAIAGAGLGAKGGFSAFRVDAAAAGATVSVGWGSMWLGLALAGAAIGGLAGAGAAYAAGRWPGPRRAGAALLAVGAVGGVLAGATWGSAVARERVVEVRAQRASAAPLLSTRGSGVSKVNGPVRLDASVRRDLNVPLLAFMVMGGTVVGALAARGLAEPLRLGRREEVKPVLDDLGRQRF